MFGFKKKKRVTSYPMGREGHPVARLLRGNRGAAMRVELIAEQTGMNENTVRSMLRRLVDDGYVAHSKPFFYWK